MDELRGEEAEPVVAEVDGPESRVRRERLRVEVGELVVAEVERVQVGAVGVVGVGAEEVRLVRGQRVVAQHQPLQARHVREGAVRDATQAVAAQV